MTAYEVKTVGDIAVLYDGTMSRLATDAEVAFWVQLNPDKDRKAGSVPKFSGSEHEFVNRIKEEVDITRGSLPDVVTVYYYDHSCEWLSKYCDEHHRKHASVPRAVLDEMRETEN